MRLTVIAVSGKMPAWVEQGVLEYRKRLPVEIKIEIRVLPLAQRSKDNNRLRILSREAEAMRRVIPARDRLIALDVAGASWSTEQLAARLADWQMSGQNFSFLIGGPDGLAAELLQQADQCWSLSPLTLPHPLVRVMLLEQLYRAWTINANHPYHRQ